MTQSDTNTAKFVLAIATGQSVAEASKKGNISKSTGYRLLNDEDVVAEIQLVRRRLLDHAIGKMADATSSAADNLGKLVEHEDPRIQLSAIRLLFDQYLKVSQRESLEERLAEIEERMIDVTGSTN